MTRFSNLRNVHKENDERDASGTEEQKHSHVGRAIGCLEVDLPDLHFKSLADHVKNLLELVVLALSAHNHGADRVSKLRGVGPRESLLFGVDGLGLCRTILKQSVINKSAISPELWQDS